MQVIKYGDNANLRQPYSWEDEDKDRFGLPEQASAGDWLHGMSLDVRPLLCRNLVSEPSLIT